MVELKKYDRNQSKCLTIEIPSFIVLRNGFGLKQRSLSLNNFHNFFEQMTKTDFKI